jgi:hypothetical protein
MPSPLSSYNVPNTPSGHNRPTVLQEGLLSGLHQKIFKL